MVGSPARAGRGRDRPATSSTRSGRRTGSGTAARLVAEAEGKLLLAEGRYDEALPVAGAGRRDAAPRRQPGLEAVAQLPGAPSSRRLGRADEARALMAEDDRPGAAVELDLDPGPHPALRRRAGRPGLRAALREAVELLGDSVARFELACAELALGRGSTSDPPSATDCCGRPCDAASSCAVAGAAAGRCAVELRADGVDVPADAAAGDLGHRHRAHRRRPHRRRGQRRAGRAGAVPHPRRPSSGPSPTSAGGSGRAPTRSCSGCSRLSDLRRRRPQVPRKGATRAARHAAPVETRVPSNEEPA